MGWCQEFGPQITENCDHAMVAGSSACSCSHCGAVCKGKFGGCVNVWARGPDQSLVRRPPVRTTVPASSSSPTSTEPSTPDAEEDSSEPGERQADAGRLALDELVSRVTKLEDMGERLEALERGGRGLDPRVLARLQQLSAQASAVDDVSERVRTLEQGNGRMRNMDNVLNHVVKDLDRVVIRTGSLDDVVTRLARLEKRIPREQQPPPGDVMRALKQLATEVEELRPVPARMAALEQAGNPSATGELRELREGLKALSAEVAALRSAPDQSGRLEELFGRLEKLEQAAPEGGTHHSKTLAAVQARLERLTAQVTSLRAVPERLQVLEQAKGTAGNLAPELVALRRDVEELSAQVAAVPGLREQVGTLEQYHDRMEALETALNGVVRGLAEMRSKETSVEGISGRLKGLEDAQARTDEVLGSMGRRFDRLGTRIGALKNVPERLELLEKTAAEADNAGGFDRLHGDVAAVSQSIEGLSDRLHRLEEASPRGDAVARGLSAAIEALDQLSAQVAGLEHTVQAWGKRGENHRQHR